MVEALLHPMTFSPTIQATIFQHPTITTILNSVESCIAHGKFMIECIASVASNYCPSFGIVKGFGACCPAVIAWCS